MKEPPSIHCTLLLLALWISHVYSICSDLANTEKVEEFHKFSSTEGYLDFTEALTMLNVDVNLVSVAIEGLSSQLADWAATNPNHTWPASTYIGWRGSYVVTEGNSTHANILCSSKYAGRLPLIEVHEDELALVSLMQRYELNQTFIKAFPWDRFGYFSPSGYFIGAYGKALRAPVEAADGSVDPPGDIGMHTDRNGDLRAVITPNGGLGIVSPHANETDKIISYLCEVPGNQCSRDNATLSECRYLGVELKDVLTRYLIWLKGIRSQITNTKDGSSDVLLPRVPNNVTVLAINQIETGIPTIRYSLSKLATTAFFNDRRVNQVLELNAIVDVVKRTYERSTLEMDMDIFPFPLTRELNNHLNKRSLGTDVLSWAGGKVVSRFRDHIGHSLINLIDPNNPTVLYYIRSFLDKSGRRLKDRWLVDDSHRPYTTRRKPVVSQCERIAGRRVCDDLFLDDQDGLRNYPCGMRMVGRESGGSCDMEYPQAQMEVYPEMNCRRRNSADSHLRHDVVLSRGEGKLVRNCGSRGTETFDLQKGTNMFPTKSSEDCTYLINNNVVHYNPPNIGHPSPAQVSTLDEGISANNEGAPESGSLFGQLDFNQVVVLALTLLSVILSIMTISLIICTPKGRLICVRNYCCCFRSGGWKSWKKNSLLARSFRQCCGQEVNPANSWEMIPMQEQEIPQDDPPQRSPRAASGSSRSRSLEPTSNSRISGRIILEKGAFGKK